MKRRECVFAGLLLSATATLAQTGSWTNKAGHVLSAEPVEIKGSQVLFKKGAQTVSYPLSVFLPSEQNRLKASLEIVEIPIELKDAYVLAQRTLKRLRLLHAEGKMSDEAYHAACAKARCLFFDKGTVLMNKGLLGKHQLSQLSL